MDICTLTVITTIFTIGCMQSEQCQVVNNRKLCISGHAISCPLPEPFYNCKRPDGSEYTIKQTDALK